MRKIEEQMLEAIRNLRSFCQANTEVYLKPDTHGDTTIGWRVYLHGNLIAELDRTGLHLSLCGWDTVTTRSRLNAIGSIFRFTVGRHKGCTYITMRDTGAKLPLVGDERVLL